MYIFTGGNYGCAFLKGQSELSGGGSCDCGMKNVLLFAWRAKGRRLKADSILSGVKTSFGRPWV